MSIDANRIAGSELVRGAIKASGLSTSKWAKTIVLRDPRTVRRWKSGESPVPALIIDWLIRGIPEP